jgi:hypothetical protein
MATPVAARCEFFRPIRFVLEGRMAWHRDGLAFDTRVDFVIEIGLQRRHRVYDIRMLLGLLPTRAGKVGIAASSFSAMGDDIAL